MGHADNDNARAPNILLIMADQMAGPALPIYGHKVVRAPHLQGLAESGVSFDNAYCNFPICAPSRASMLTGRLPASIDAFDNSTELPASTPTLAHYLADLGYKTILCGKMHFVGPDQLHGFHERLVTDIYPADFSWTPNWEEGPHKGNAATRLNVRPVIEAGQCIRSLQIDYDDEVEHFGIQKIYDLARSPSERPFLLIMSFTHPHHPFVTTKEYWDRYRHEEIDMPSVPAIPVEKLDAWSRWQHYAREMDLYTVTDEHVRNARHAYYGMISYVDDKVGRILRTMKDTGLDDNTIIVFTSDHGEMMGERGMWYKGIFYEWSSRVPLIISWRGAVRAGHCKQIVSLVDLVPTLLDLATDGHPPEPVEPFDGNSMAALFHDKSDAWPDIAISDYTATGTIVPCRMIRKGAYKYIYTHNYPAQLFNLEHDPHELRDLAGKPQAAEVEEALRKALLRNWDPDKTYSRVLASQKRRRYIHSVSRKFETAPNWAFKAPNYDEFRFVRGGGKKGPMDTKARARFPYVPPTAPDQAAVAKPDAQPTDKDLGLA